jgi:hypothetical protein
MLIVREEHGFSRHVLGRCASCRCSMVRWPEHLFARAEFLALACVLQRRRFKRCVQGKRVREAFSHL